MIRKKKLRQPYVGDAVLPLGEALGLEDVLPLLPDGDALVLVPHRHLRHPLLPLTLELEGGDLRGKEAVPDELLGARGVLHHLDLLPHDLRGLLDGGALLPDGPAHLAGVHHEDDAAVPVVDDAVPAARAGELLELGHVAHAVLGEHDLAHGQDLARVRMSDSPGSATARAETRKGFPQAMPSWTPEPAKTWTGTPFTPSRNFRNSAGQFAATTTSFAFPSVMHVLVLFCPRKTFPVFNALLSEMLKSMCDSPSAWVLR